jgi:Zn-dependent protease with chaperone function
MGPAGAAANIFGTDPGLRITRVSAATFAFGPTAVGQSVDVDYHRAMFSGLVHAPSLERHLNDIAEKLRAQSPVTGIPVRVYVRATSVYGAESSADANIYLNYRTVERIESDDEAAAILGHELAHIILGHPSADIVEDTQARMLAYTTMALAVYSTVGRQFGGAQGVGTATGVAASEALLLQVTQGVVAPAWTRSQEEEADLLGLDLLIRAGYDPRAMEAMLNKLLEAERQGIDEHGFGDRVKTYFKDRWPELVRGGRNDAVKTVVGMGTESVVKWLKRDHPDTATRIAEVGAYRAKYHADAPDRDPAIKPWHEATRRGDRETKRVFQSYGDAITAAQEIAKGDAHEALRLATEAATPDMQAHTFVVEALYHAQKVAGARHRTAAQLFDPPVRGTEPTWLAFREMGFAQLVDGDTKGGVATLERGYDRLQRPPDAVGALLYAYERTGQRDKATMLASQCINRFPRMASHGGCKSSDPNATDSPKREDHHDVAARDADGEKAPNWARRFQLPGAPWGNRP